jgi:hypothetical protein
VEKRSADRSQLRTSQKPTFPDNRRKKSGR